MKINGTFGWVEVWFVDVFGGGGLVVGDDGGSGGEGGGGLGW